MRKSKFVRESHVTMTELVLPNDTDLTFAAVRTADDSLRRLLAAAGGLPDASARAVAVATSVM